MTMLDDLRVVEPLDTVRVFGVDLARADLTTTVDHLLGLTDLDQFSYVVTTNVDHMVELQSNVRFQRAYATATVRVADGAPIVAVGRLAGHQLRHRVTGADLMPELCRQAAVLGLPVAIIGGAAEVNEAAVETLRSRYPGIEVDGFSPYGFEKDPTVSRDMVDRLWAMKPKLAFFCFGAPRSEIWVAEHAHLLPSCVAVCAGAAVDFIAGTVGRAPSWVQFLGLEWCYRLIKEPRRLWRRYLVRDLAFLPIAAREIVRRVVRAGRSRPSPAMAVAPATHRARRPRGC
jgi:exopolysaccharide biosynthesis WecB/TagA/CpsF family protein